MSAKKFEFIDKNLQVNASISDIDLTMYSVRQKPFSLYEAQSSSIIVS